MRLSNKKQGVPNITYTLVYVLGPGSTGKGGGRYRRNKKGGQVIIRKQEKKSNFLSLKKIHRLKRSQLLWHSSIFT